MIPHLVVLASALTAPPPGTRGGVWWELDHANHLVIANARITFWHEDRVPSPAFVVETIDALRRGWEGQPILCYRLHIRIHADVAAGPDKIPADSIGIRLYDLPAHSWMDPGTHHRVYPYTRSRIAGHAHIHANWYGDDPTHRGIPEVGPVYLTQPAEQSRLWTTDPRPMTLTHEFGHVLGLSDNYGPNGTLMPHAVPDAMFNNGVTGPGKFFPETITKAVRRAGVDLAELQCSRHLESTPIDMSLHAAVGYVGLDELWIEADNCAWLPPSSDPAYANAPNLWSGTLRFRPRMETPESAGEFTIHPVFKTKGEAESPVKFTTLSRRDEDSGPERWRTWETVQLYDDKDFTATADLQLRSMNKPPAAENLRLHEHFGASRTGQFAYKSDVPIAVTVRQEHCEQPR